MDDPENLDDLLDMLPGRLRRKVAQHLNSGEGDEAGEDGAEGEIELPLIPPPPRPPPPLPDKRYDFSHTIQPYKETWWGLKF